MANKAPSPITIGVLALQGSFAEHITTLDRLGYKAIPVRTPEQLATVDGLIMPGGESTAIGKLLHSSKLFSAITKQAKAGMPVYGTCAGCILVANTVDSEYSLQLIDISVERNAYGRQIDSFEAELQSDTLPPVTGIFIRAPRITNTKPSIEILYTYQNEPVLVQQGNILAGTFHPELTPSTVVHQYFAEMVIANRGHWKPIPLTVRFH